MRLRYTRQDGTSTENELSERPLTIGRSQDADIVLMDEKASRIHCGIRLWDGDFYIKDLKSKNGTFVNGQRVEVSKLKAGDTIRVGSSSFTFEQDPNTGADTALREIKGEMELGKGYTTILKQIVEDAEQPQSPAPEAQPPPALESQPKEIPAEPKAAPQDTPAAIAPSVPAPAAAKQSQSPKLPPPKKPMKIMIRKKPTP